MIRLNVQMTPSEPLATEMAHWLDNDWMDAAACRGVDPELFFPEGRGSQATPAVKVCSTCPVMAECFEYGKNEQYGVYGGVSANQRGAPRNVRQDHGVREWLRAR